MDIEQNNTSSKETLVKLCCTGLLHELNAALTEMNWGKLQQLVYLTQTMPTVYESKHFPAEIVNRCTTLLEQVFHLPRTSVLKGEVDWISVAAPAFHTDFQDITSDTLTASATASTKDSNTLMALPTTATTTTSAEHVDYFLPLKLWSDCLENESVSLYFVAGGNVELRWLVSAQAVIHYLSRQPTNSSSKSKVFWLSKSSCAELTETQALLHQASASLEHVSNAHDTQWIDCAQSTLAQDSTQNVIVWINDLIWSSSWNSKARKRVVSPTLIQLIDLSQKYTGRVKIIFTAVHPGMIPPALFTAGQLYTSFILPAQTAAFDQHPTLWRSMYCKQAEDYVYFTQLLRKLRENPAASQQILVIENQGTELQVSSLDSKYRSIKEAVLRLQTALTSCAC